MPWVRVDDGFPEHMKVMNGARHLGSNGAGRILAVWLQGMCYANRNLTDGFLPEAVVKSWTLYDRKPLDVAFVMEKVGLLRRVDGGFRFHDYEHYQPLAEAVKAKRTKDRDRKIRKDSTRNPRGIQAESARIPGVPYPNPSPRSQEQGADAPDVNILTKLVHSILDTDGQMRLARDEFELSEEVKCQAARAHIPYDSTAVCKAIESARYQRKLVLQ